MRSGIFKIRKYMQLICLALTLSASVFSVYGQQPHIIHVFIKGSLLSTEIRSAFNNSRRYICEVPHTGLTTFDHTIYNSINIWVGTPVGNAYDTGINSGKPVKSTSVGMQIHQPWYGIWYTQLITLLLFLIILMIIIRKTISYVKSTERKKAELAKKITDLEIQALQAQISPHFIFNSINNIQYFILSNKTDEVLSYLSDFSKVVRALITNVNQRMVPLSGIIDFLNSYLRIEKMRFPDKFEFRVEMVGQLDPLSIMIPPYLIQPFAENAVKHGFLHRNSTGHLSITFENTGNEIMKCSIIDNGIGRAKSLEMEDTVAYPLRTHSIEITEERIHLFNTPEKPDRFKVVYTDLIDSEGSAAGLKVEISLPMEIA